jgi:hypothetical protein
MKTKIKKLNVSKQTVANLEDSEARVINGGAFPMFWYSNAVCNITGFCGPTRDDVA